MQGCNQTVRCVSLVVLAFACGCASSGPKTLLQVRSGPKGVAGFEYRDVYWRPAPQVDGGIEVIGYGFMSFYNDPMSRDYDSRWPRMGQVVIWVHGISQPQDKFEITMLGPSMSLGPGDDEIMTGAASGVQIESGDKDARTIRIPATPVQSRNRPNMEHSLSGTFIATRTDDSTFDKQLRQFNLERSYRGPANAIKP